MPKDQWCYMPNEEGRYAEGMTIPADVLRANGLSPAHRGGVGIRLPGGYDDQPYYGAQHGSAGRYAWYLSQQPQNRRLAVREPPAERSGVVRHAGERV